MSLIPLSAQIKKTNLFFKDETVKKIPCPNKIDLQGRSDLNTKNEVKNKALLDFEKKLL